MRKCVASQAVTMPAAAPAKVAARVAAYGFIPDVIKSWNKHNKVMIRYPDAIRPWQHVLEPLTGYLILAEKLYEEGNKYSGSWNFGPNEDEIKTVHDVLTALANIWSEDATWELVRNINYHEAVLLRLDCSKARILLNWYPKWSIDTTLNKLSIWYKAYFRKQENMLQLTQEQIIQYMED